MNLVENGSNMNAFDKFLDYSAPMKLDMAESLVENAGELWKVGLDVTCMFETGTVVREEPCMSISDWLLRPFLMLIDDHYLKSQGSSNINRDVAQETYELTKTMSVDTAQVAISVGAMSALLQSTTQIALSIIGNLRQNREDVKNSIGNEVVITSSLEETPAIASQGTDVDFSELAVVKIARFLADKVHERDAPQFAVLEQTRGALSLLKMQQRTSMEESNQG
jgi:hypothetical protein